MDAPFHFRDFLKVFALSICLYAGFFLLFSFFPLAINLLEGVHPTVSFLIQYAIQFVILFFPLWFFVVDKYATDFSAFGFRKVRVKRLLSIVILTYLFYLLVSTGFLMLMEVLQWEVPGYQEQESYLPLFGSDTISFVVAFLFMVIIAPFLEELFFRGFVYRTFLKTWPTWLASVATALLFALIHFQFSSIIPLFFLGLLLNFVYHRTASVWTAVAFHMLNNSMAYALELTLHFNPNLLQELEAASAFLYNIARLF